MHAFARRVTNAAVIAEGLDMTAALICGSFGAWAGYSYSPDTWSHNWRLIFAGLVAVTLAAAASSLAEPFLSRLRAPRATHNELAAPTLDEGLAKVAAATEVDAAYRAAFAARYAIAQGGTFLGDTARWRGYENGEASLYLAPGVWLHFRSETNKQGSPEKLFSLLTGDGDQPVSITNVAQIRHHLAARAAGLPAAPVASNEHRVPDGVLGDDLTGLHT